MGGQSPPAREQAATSGVPSAPRDEAAPTIEQPNEKDQGPAFVELEEKLKKMEETLKDQMDKAQESHSKQDELISKLHMKLIGMVAVKAQELPKP